MQESINIQSMLRVGTILRGIYRIDRYLSSGGFGNTYVATNIEFDERVAIKEFFMKGVTQRDANQTTVSVSNSENTDSFLAQKEKFKKEARRLRKLDNEHIVKVHDLFEENGTAYYVMDYIDGENLNERLKRIGQPMLETEVNLILPQILDALKAVHDAEIWHLDIKPSNIMEDKSGNVYLIDFGASKQIRANGSMTTSTALCYTPGYAPNEQIGQMYDRFGPWTDIYALGATIYNLLTNKMPPMVIDIEEDEEDAFEFSTSTSEDMCRLVVWMMQPKRKARPQNVMELIERLISKHFSTSDHDGKIVSKEPPFPIEIIEGNRQSDDKEQTVFDVPSKNQKQKPIKQLKVILLHSAIKVGDYIYDDGTCSDTLETKKNLIGILFSNYGGVNGQIFSSVKPKETLSINGKELKWHEATLTEWVNIIQNLGHSKVFFESREYRFFSSDVQHLLSNYSIKDTKYATGQSLSGVAYVVDLTKCNLTPIEGVNTLLPYIYISDI